MHGERQHLDGTGPRAAACGPPQSCAARSRWQPGGFSNRASPVQSWQATRCPACQPPRIGLQQPRLPMKQPPSLPYGKRVDGLVKSGQTASCHSKRKQFWEEPSLFVSFPHRHDAWQFAQKLDFQPMCNPFEALHQLLVQLSLQKTGLSALIHGITLLQ